MSGYGWNSGYGNFNGGFSRGLPSHPNPNNFQENCVLCNRVFYSTEALINHYEAHMRDDELTFRSIRGGNLNLHPYPFQPQPPFNPLNAAASSSTSQALLQANYLHIQNQASIPQRNLALGPNQPFFPPPIQPPSITRNNQPIIQQQQQLQQQQQQQQLQLQQQQQQLQLQQQQQQQQLQQQQLQQQQLQQQLQQQQLQQQQQQLPPPPPPPAQQQQQMMRQAVQRANLVPPNNVNMRVRAAAAQPNQPVARADEIELEFGDDDNSSQDGSINLDLTLGL